MGVQRFRFVNAIVASAFMLAVTACGGGDDVTFSTPEDTSAIADSPTDDATADPVGDELSLEDQLRTSAAFEDADIEALSLGDQECIISAVAADPDLAAAALADEEPSDAEALALTSIMLECAPDLVRDLMSDGDPTGDEFLDSLSDEEVACIVDELVADPSVLSDAVNGGDGVDMGLALLGCAPDVVAESMAAELGVSVDQAACLLEEDGALMELMLAEGEFSDDESLQLLDDMFTAFVDCGIDMSEMIGDIDVDTSLGDDSGDPFDLTQFRADCAAGDMEACDALFFQSEVGSDDEDFGASCGGTADGSTAGMCSYLPATAEELAQYRADCSSGDMEACDDLYYNSEFGSDDETFGATCGGTADGVMPGSCWLDG